MKEQKRVKNLLLAIAAIAGASAISANAATENLISVSVTNPAKIQLVMNLASQMGFDYTIRPKLDATGHFQAGVVEISIEDRVSYAALRNMVAN